MSNAARLAGERPPLVFLELHVEMIRARGEDPAEVPALLWQADYRTFAWNDTPLHDDAILARPLVRFLAVAGKDMVRWDMTYWGMRDAR